MSEQPKTQEPSHVDVTLCGSEWCWKEQNGEPGGGHLLSEVATASGLTFEEVLGGKSVVLGAREASVRKMERCLGGCGRRPRVDIASEGTKSSRVSAKSVEELTAAIETHVTAAAQKQ